MQDQHITAILDEYEEKKENLFKNLLQYKDAARKRKADPNDPLENDDLPRAVFQKFFNLNGNPAIMTMTNFTKLELDVLFAVCESELNLYYGRGRGKKPTTSPYDSFFITLSVLKHYQRWEKAALDFGMKLPTLESLVMRTIDIIEPVLSKHLIQKKSMTELLNTKPKPIQFDHFKDCIIGHDVRFQTCQKPKVSQID
jgi:hypothetical protein